MIVLMSLCAVPYGAGAQEPEVAVAELAAPSPVTASGGTAVFSRLDAATGRYELVLQQVNGLPLVLPFATQRAPFEADLGTDSDGRPAVIAAVEGGADRGTSGGLDLQVLTIDRDAAPRPVRNANTGADEHAPTIDQGRIAFARTSAGRTGDVVYTKRLVAPRARPSTRLPGVPTRRCALGRPPGSTCVTGERSVQQLDLVDAALAQHVRYRVGGAASYFEDEIRWVVLGRGTSRPVAHVSGGESAQRFEGVQLAGSRISWYRGCERVCPGQYTAAFRYRPGVGYDVDPTPPGGLSGFAGTGDGTWQIRGAQLDTCGGDDDLAATPCTLVRTHEPRWTRIAASRVR